MLPASDGGLRRCRHRRALDSLRTANYSEVLDAQSNLRIVGRIGVARLCGARVCRVGHAVPRVPQRRHRHRQLRRVRARRRSPRVLDADRRCRPGACGESELARGEPARVGDQLDRDGEVCRVRAAHALYGEQRRVRLRRARRRRGGDAERDCARQRREGAAEHGGRRPAPPCNVAERSLWIPRRRRGGNAGIARRSDLGPSGCCWRIQLRDRPGCDGASRAIRAIGCRCSERRRPSRPSRTRLPRRRPPTSRSIEYRFFAVSLPRSTIRATRSLRPGRGRPADGRFTRSPRKGESRKRMLR